MLDRATGRWTGIALSLVTVIGTLWLAATGNLDLYVHPRYFGFTIVMAVLGGAVSIAALTFLPGSEAIEEVREAREATAPVRTWHTPLIRVSGRLLVLGAATFAILVLPPATLSPAIAGTRELNAGSATDATVGAVELAGNDGSTFTVKDWAGLLRQGLPADFFAGKTADVTGFVLPAKSADTFYLTRYLITHCAIDAQPLGVPVYWPDWEQQLDPDSWLAIEGAFETNPDSSFQAPIVLVPSRTEQVDEPDDPYVY